MLLSALWTNAIPPPVLQMEIALYPVGQILCAVSISSNFTQVSISAQVKLLLFISILIDCVLLTTEDQLTKP